MGPGISRFSRMNFGLEDASSCIGVKDVEKVKIIRLLQASGLCIPLGLDSNTSS